MSAASRDSVAVPTAVPPLTRPRRLLPGDVVRVVAPSGAVDPERLAAGAKVLESWGLVVEVGEHAMGRAPQGYLAGSDQDRASDLERAWCDPRVAAVVCARGGYGVQRMVDLVDWPQLRAARPVEESPVLVGFSDITALHEAVAVELGVVTLHGPMAASLQLVDSPSNQESLRRSLFEPDDAPPVTGAEATTLVPGTASGVLVGGNLSLLASGLGTPSTRRTYADAVLLLEEVDEEPYRLDRMLTQLVRSGALEGVAGIAGGTWKGCGARDVVDELLLDRLGGLGVPVVNGLDVGHTADNLTVPLGVPAVLDADRRLLHPSPALR